MSKKIKQTRINTGFGLVEAVTSSVFVVVAVILSIDCWFMITAARITDAACRDAARAASQAQDSTTANNAAMAAVLPYAQYGSNMMTAPQPTVTFNNSAATPSVTVVTTTSVMPLIPLSVLGSSFNGMTFSQQYSFPLVRTVLAANATVPVPSTGSSTTTTTSTSTTTTGPGVGGY